MAFRFCVVACAMIVVPLFAHAQVSVGGDVNANGSCFAMGNGNNVNCGPTRVGLSDEIAAKLLSAMPDKTKTVALSTVGNTADQVIGTQTEAFLVKHGYNVSRTVIGQVSPPPDRPFTLQMNGNQYRLMVAPSAR